MKAKDFVLSKFPNVSMEVYRSNGKPSSTLAIIRINRSDVGCIGRGNGKRNAWKNAQFNIENNNLVDDKFGSLTIKS